MSTTKITEDEINLVEKAKLESAQAIVKEYMKWTGAAGIIPFPIADTAAIAAFQVAMVNKIGKVYGFEFPSHWTKSVISSLVGSYASTALGKGIGMNIVRSLPVIGGLASIIVAPGFAAASTWALGQVFITHFASGETMLTFDPSKVKDYYNQLVKGQLPAAVKTDDAATKELIAAAKAK
jgi:uncharacterized protein (DUF697 family)